MLITKSFLQCHHELQKPAVFAGAAVPPLTRQVIAKATKAKAGSNTSQDNPVISAADQFNQQHITLAGYEKETQTPADELAASRTARAAVFIRNDPARPTQTGEMVGMLPAPKGKRFTMTEQQTLLSHGVATAYVESGVLRIQRDVTTYRKNAYGVADNSYLDSETLHTSAYVLRKLKSVITSKYGRHKLASDGTRFGPGQAIVTPAVIKGELLATYRQLERAGIVENYELFKQYLVVERDPALVCSADDEAGYFQGRHDCNAFFYRLGDGRDLRKRFYNVAWFWKLNPLELRRTAISHFADLEAEAVRINEEMKHG